MKKISLLGVFISSFLVNAQNAPGIEWQKSLGGSRGDQARSIQQTTDGGYIVAGRSFSNDGDVTVNHGDYDYWIVKTDASGTIEWQKSLGGSDEDFAQSIQQTSDGGYIVAGYSDSHNGDVSGNHGMHDFWIVKLDENGNIQWQKSLGGTHEDRAHSVQQTSDGGYIVAGYSYSHNGDVTENRGVEDYWIVKLEVNGNIQWQKSYGGSRQDIALSIQQTSDDNYIVLGRTRSNDGDVIGGTGDYLDYWVLKLNESGNILWQKILGGSSSDVPGSIQQTIEGGYIIAGYSSSNDGDVTNNTDLTSTNFWIVKLDENGGIQWEKSIGENNVTEMAYEARQTMDGGFIVIGETAINYNPQTGYDDAWVMKLDSFGVIQWQKIIEGSGFDKAYSILQTADYGYIFAGRISGNEGNNGESGSDFWIVKLSADGMGTQELQNIKISIYPIPVKDILYFSEEVSNIKITDFSGKIVKEIPASGKSVDVYGLTKGVYMITATSKSGKIVSGKFIKE